ncbi:hypothetical protein VTK73DRAFT_3006 [Phialemonium thermophilum]|uniref:Transcriptional regulatory protein n=1 Tax=Phialemonium thermophilum TaxID=223376 RepID=A0ABR3Y1A9_9PEZI
MATLGRGLRRHLRAPPVTICSQCSLRMFASSSVLLSGHNKWSKIRHDKAAADAKKNAVRNQFTKTITLYSRLYGPDPTQNPQLATTLAAAKKAGVPKAVIETAVARGQGRSTEGATLENVTFEAIFPPSVALIVEAETDNRLRLLQDLNLIVKKNKAMATASRFYFTRLGRVVFQKDEAGEVGVDQIMDTALEAGAEDLEDGEDGTIVAWTQPNQTTQVCEAVGGTFGLKVLSSDIIWSPNEDTKVKLDWGSELKSLAELLAKLQDNPDVQAVYSNISRGNMTDEEWASLADNIDV